MHLSEFKKKYNLTYYEMADETGIPRAVLHRICTQKGYCIKLSRANTLVKWSKNVVTYEDLLPEGC